MADNMTLCMHVEISDKRENNVFLIGTSNALGTKSTIIVKGTQDSKWWYL